MEAWVSPLPRGCPRPESLLPERPAEKLPFQRRGTNQHGVAPVKIRLEPGPLLRKPRNGPLALGETRGPGNTISAVGYIPPPPGGDRPVKAAFSRNPSRSRAHPRNLAFHPFDRSRPSVQPPNLFPNQPKKPGGASPNVPVTGPVLPCTGEMILLPAQWRK